MTPPYPRIPHIAPHPAATRDDLVLDDAERAALLAGPVHVEEKLDGANVMLWIEDHAVQVASRGGPGAIDRAGQLGRLRAWASERADALRRLLADGRVLYAEWLLLTHSIRYDRLPDYLLGLDLWSPDAGFASVSARDRALAAAGIAVPAARFAGMVPDLAALDRLIGRSAYRAGEAEGVVVRALDPLEGRPRIAKRLAPSFVRRDDHAWRRGRPLNVLR